MSLNLITDRWIPVVRGEAHTTIRPDEVVCADVIRLDWPRSDLNLACLELLIGLVFLAAAPRNTGEWRTRTPDLRSALAPFAPCFELCGDGPRFAQDLEPFEDTTPAHPPDMLFIDSAGRATEAQNADLMVKRGRYPVLSPALGAMALYTLQAFAPSGGAGHRTSMRGGGPLITLAQPEGPPSLWRLLWANVPDGEPLAPADARAALPWLRPTRTSSRGETVTPQMSHPAEAFFAMPRRLRLHFSPAGEVIGVTQKRHGARYAGWRHPLSPYYRDKSTQQWMPMHPKPGKISYRDWLGLLFGESERGQCACAVRRYAERTGAPARVLAGGWSMRNMKPVDYDLHTYPAFGLAAAGEHRARALTEAAHAAWTALARSLTRALPIEGSALDPIREAFYTATEADFVRALTEPDTEPRWLDTLRTAALALFDRHALPGLPDRRATGPASIEATARARRMLLGAFTLPKEQP